MRMHGADGAFARADGQHRPRLSWRPLTWQPNSVGPAGRWTAGRGVLALPAYAEALILELTIAGAMADRPAQREAA